jgi:hypothetical protein
MHVEDSVDASKIYFLAARRANVLVSCKILHESEEQARACVNAKYYTKRIRVKLPFRGNKIHTYVSCKIMHFLLQCKTDV